VFEIWSLKNYSFSNKLVLFKVSPIFGTHCVDFVSMRVNKIKPRVILCPTFSLNTHHQYWTNLEWKCTDTLAELDNTLKKVARDYSLVQNPKILNRMLHLKNNTKWNILPHLIQFENERFRFCFFAQISKSCSKF
jgi:hypothetical protein